VQQFYVQNGVTYANSEADIADLSGNSLTDDFCAAQKSAFNDNNTFKSYGGMKAMGNAFKSGMVLVMSIWDDYAVNMLWLDSDYPTDADPSQPGVNRGPCSTDSGVPADVESQSPGSTVVFSNIKTGPIGSTFNSGSTGGNGGNGGNGGTTTKGTTTTKATTTTKPTTTTTKATTTTQQSACATKYGQCGGKGWQGPTCCASGSTCKSSGEYYSQCL
jgi:cellulose 1,4-beta-cellobiosidase